MCESVAYVGAEWIGYERNVRFPVDNVPVGITRRLSCKIAASWLLREIGMLTNVQIKCVADCM